MMAVTDTLDKTVFGSQVPCMYTPHRVDSHHPGIRLCNACALETQDGSVSKANPSQAGLMNASSEPLLIVPSSFAFPGHRQDRKAEHIDSTLA